MRAVRGRSRLMVTGALFDNLGRAIAEASPEQLLTLVGQLGAASATASARLVAPPSTVARADVPEGNISAAEAARRLGVSTSYLYKNAKTLPFTIRIGRRLVCSAPGLDRWNRAQTCRV